MSEDGTGDLAGIGKIAEAIPEAGWQKAIDTACDTFTDLIAPITRTTAGLGGLSLRRVCFCRPILPH